MKELHQYVSDFSEGLGGTVKSSVAHHKYLLIIALLLTLLAGGVSTIPGGNLRMLQSFAADPIGSPLLSTYHGETPLFFFLAKGIGATTLPRYLSLCGGLIALAHLLVCFYTNRRKSPPMLLCLLLFATHPISYILQTWIGMVDGLTVSCTVVILFSSSIRILAPVSLVLMLNHTAAPFIALPLVVLRVLAGESGVGLRHVVLVALSLLVGKILLMLFHLTVHESVSRLDYILNIPWSYWAKINIVRFPLVVYSMCFALWLPVICMILLFFKQNRRFYGFYMLSMVSFYCITLVTKDTTRVFALLSWAPTLYCLLHTWDRTAGESREAVVFRASVVVTALFGWCLPRLFVWDGNVHAPWMEQPIRLIWRVLTARIGVGG